VIDCKATVVREGRDALGRSKEGGLPGGFFPFWEVRQDERRQESNVEGAFMKEGRWREEVQVDGVNKDCVEVMD
jgi:hypothetical protein